MIWTTFNLKTLQVHLLFFMFNLSIYCNSIYVARHWNVYVSKWQSLDNDLKALHIFDINSEATNKKIRRWFVVWTVALLIYTLSLYSRGLLSSLCDNRRTDSFGEYFFTQNFSDFFKTIPYHISIGIFFLLVDVYATYAWQFNDLFIVLVSFLITKQFKLFNSKISLNLSVWKLNFKSSELNRFFRRTHHLSFGMITQPFCKSSAIMLLTQISFLELWFWFLSSPTCILFAWSFWLAWGWNWNDVEPVARYETLKTVLKKA